MGIDLLVEKPIAATEEEADALIAAAAAGDRILQVGHTERYNPAVKALAESIGRPRFIEVHRLGVFSPRSTDIDVVLDLMIHDLDILLQLTGSAPERVDAIGVSALTERVDIANARLAFPGGIVANLTASRISAQKVRKLRVFESSAYHSLDYSDQQVERYALVQKEGERVIEHGTLPVTRRAPAPRSRISLDCVRSRAASPARTAPRLALAIQIARAARMPAAPETRRAAASAGNRGMPRRPRRPLSRGGTREGSWPAPSGSSRRPAGPSRAPWGPPSRARARRSRGPLRSRVPDQAARDGRPARALRGGREDRSRRAGRAIPAGPGLRSRRCAHPARPRAASRGASRLAALLYLCENR
jgi:hypothetical protein